MKLYQLKVKEHHRTNLLAAPAKPAAPIASTIKPVAFPTRNVRPAETTAATIAKLAETTAAQTATYANSASHVAGKTAKRVDCGAS